MTQDAVLRFPSPSSESESITPVVITLPVIFFDDAMNHQNFQIVLNI